jgi:TolB-like protein/Flp pilus assembly protein TadD
MAEAAETKSTRTASILSIGLVGKCSADALERLGGILRNSMRFRIADVGGKVVVLPNDDGMTLVFFSDAEAPLECATEIGRELRDQSELNLRVGICSGPVQQSTGGEGKVTGEAINLAREVMRCGEAGHILLTKRAAFDLATISRWNDHFDELGEFEVNDRQKIALVNFCDGKVGHAALPVKISRAREKAACREKRRRRPLVFFLLIVAVAIGFGYFFSRRGMQSPNATAPAPKTIAVLPFVDLSPSHEHEFFADGVSEQILEALTSIRGLRVIGRASSFALRNKNADAQEMARKLKVQTVLLGRLRRVGDSMWINAQLVNGHDGSNVWSKTFTRDAKDLPAVEQEIIRAVANALQMQLRNQSFGNIEGDPVTNDLYLQGLLLSRKTSEEDLRGSLDFFRLALERDPKYSPAWTQTAKIWIRLGENYIAPSEAYEHAREAATKALAIDDRDAEALAYLAETKRVLSWDLKGEESDLKRALEIDPNCVVAHLFFARLKMWAGETDKARTQIEAAMQIDPLSPAISDLQVAMDLTNDRLDEALVAARRTMEIDSDYTYFEPDLALVYREQGKLAEAVDIYLRLESTRRQPQPGLAIAYARLDRQEEARNVLQQLVRIADEKYSPAEQIAAGYVVLGEGREAFRWLERAANEHSAGIHGIGCVPEFRSLRSDPRFTELLRRIGLDPKKFQDRSASR